MVRSTRSGADRIGSATTRTTQSKKRVTTNAPPKAATVRARLADRAKRAGHALHSSPLTSRTHADTHRQPPRNRTSRVHTNMPNQATKRAGAGMDARMRVRAARPPATPSRPAHTTFSSSAAHPPPTSAVAGTALTPSLSPTPTFFDWLLGVSRARFFARFFEKQHLHVSHSTEHGGDGAGAGYFAAGLPNVVPGVDWSTAHMLQTVTKQTLYYGRDVHVVRLDPASESRVSYKTDGVVTADELRACMSAGWSVRFLRPQEYAHRNAAFLATMEREFNCSCGASSYWTPADSQGFAPHYDDVDVFLLQLEGEKQWRLYDPPAPADWLSRYSSEDYVAAQCPTPTHALTLRAGDVLYLPRGAVHQGRTPAHTHSLHITFSANQRNTWADLIKSAAEYCVESLAASEDTRWRRALHPSVTRVMGELYGAQATTQRWGGGGGVVLPALSAVKQRQRAQWQAMWRDFVAQLVLRMTDEDSMDVCADGYATAMLRKMQPARMGRWGGSVLGKAVWTGDAGAMGRGAEATMNSASKEDSREDRAETHEAARTAAQTGKEEEDSSSRAAVAVAAAAAVTSQESCKERDTGDSNNRRRSATDDGAGNGADNTTAEGVSSSASATHPLRHDSLVRFVSPYCARMSLRVPGEVRLRHSGGNDVVCLAGCDAELRFESDFAPAVALLLIRAPNGEWVRVGELPFPGFEDAEDVAENQMVLAQSLYDAGILSIRDDASV